MNESLKFIFNEGTNYIKGDSEANKYFIAMRFAHLDLKYNSYGYLYLRDVLEYFGMFEYAKTVPIYLGWDRERGHEFKHYWEETMTTFDIIVTLNPYDISKEA